jgi:predicted permease
MRLWHRTRELLRTLFRPGRVHRDLDDELADWLETIAARHRERGVPPDEAARRARLEIGGVAQVKEEAVSIRNGAQIESTSLDLRYALRGLRRTPGFTAAAVLTFALGIAATTAIFSVVRTILIEPLPYREAGRLAFIWADLTDLGYPHAPLAGPELVEFQRNASSFERIGGIWATNTTIGGHGDPEQLRIATVTPDFFATLGVDAALGRTLGPSDFGQTVTPVLLSHRLWADRFGSDRSVVGMSVTLNDRPAVIAGVMAADFELHFPPDAAVPKDLQAWVPGSPNLASQPRGQQYLRVVGRVKRGVSLQAAIQEVASVGAAMTTSNPGSYSPGSRFYAVGMHDDTVRPLRPAVLALFGGVLILLVIACVNIAGLLIVRASARRRETSMRLALGASRGRLLRQCLVEGLLLASLGGALGVAGAFAGVRLLVALAPASLPRVHATDVDGGVLLFAAGASLLWGVAFSALPWLEVRRVDIAGLLQHGGRLTASRSTARARAALVVAQIGLGVVLMVGAALLARTFVALVRLDPGFRTEQRLGFRIAPSFQRYRPLDGMNTFHRSLSEKLRALPTVTAVGSISHFPFDNLPNWGTPYLPIGETDGARAGLADTRAVSPGFFEAIGATVLRGRVFTDDEAARSPMPVVVDDLMARRLFGSDDPIGRQYKVDLGGTGQMQPMQIIGVVGHLRHRSLMEAGREQLFVSSRLWPRNPASYVVRTTADPLTLIPAVRSALREVDPVVPMYDVRVLDDYVDVARAPSRFTMVIAVTFAVIALVLATVGVFGVMAYSVGRRVHEFGIRRALGAEPGAIIRMVLAEASWLGLVGFVLGTAAALGLSRFMRHLLFGVTPHDPAAYVTTIVTLGLALLVASWLPVHRAATSPPATVLKNDA